MLLKIAMLNARIGGLEERTRNFEHDRRENLITSEQQYGRINPGNIELSKALINYVKFFYENSDNCEDILTENLKMICFATGLKEDEMKR